MRRLLLVIAAFLASAAPASADVISSSISAPADPSFLTYDADLGPDAPANRLTVTGVAAFTPLGLNLIDVRCFWTDSGGTLRANPLALRVPLIDLGNGTGSFSVSADPATLSDNPFADGTRDDAPGVQTCRLRATPAVPVITDLLTSALPDFAGPRVNVARFGSTALGVRGGGNVTVDYTVGAGGLRGQAQWSSRCGPFSFRPYVNPAGFSPALYPNWDCVRAVLPPDVGDGASQVRVDGVPAYTGSSAPAFDFDANGVAERPAGATGLSVEYRRGVTTGTITTIERSPVQRCETAVFPPTAATCTTLGATGVELERRTVFGDDGLEATITDILRSADGAAHRVEVDAEQYVVFDNDPAFRFPGEDAFAPHGAGDQPALGAAGGPGSVLTRDAITPDTPRQGSGAETWDTRPDDVRFFATDYQYLERSAQTVPAGGATTSTRVFRAARTLAEAEAGARAAEQRLAPPVVPPPAVPPPPVVTAPPAPGKAVVPVARCRVPRLSRSSLYGTARSKIKRAGCAVGKVRRVRSSLRKGRLVRIRPSGGRTVARGTRIAVDLSDGKGKKPRRRATKRAVPSPSAVQQAGAIAEPARPRSNARAWTPPAS